MNVKRMTTTKEAEKGFYPTPVQVADSFHGDGTEGSGQKAYTNVYARQQYYLADPVSNTLALSVGN